ncbi:MAG: AI-2E family transporter [Pseudomonadota bacterium]
MKPSSMRIAFLVLFAVLTILFVRITWPFATAAFLAFTLAVMFFPLQKLMLEKCRLPRYLAAVATTVVVAVCVLIPLAVLVSVAVSQMSHFLQELATQAGHGSFADSIEPVLAAVQAWIERVAGSAPSIEDLQTTLLSGVTEAAKKFYEFSPRVITTTVSVTANFLLTLIFLVVFLAEGSNLYDWVMETTPLSAEHRRELARDVRVAITSSIVAALVTAVIQGALLGLGFWLAGFGQPYSWGLIAIVLSVIPVIGAASCYITATVVLFTAGNIKGAILFFIFGVGIISTIDNFIRPIVFRGSLNMHPLLLFVTLIGAVKLLGPVGLIVGPVLLSIFLAALRIYRREFALTA